jgi:ethanolamine utilization protein EutN
MVGKVVGTVWSTKKQETLEGLRFLLVRPVALTGDAVGPPIVAADNIGAGIGETVIVAFGRAARTTLGNQDIAYQTAVVGIVDEIELEGGKKILG